MEQQGWLTILLLLVWNDLMEVLVKHQLYSIGKLCSEQRFSEGNLMRWKTFQ